MPPKKPAGLTRVIKGGTVRRLREAYGIKHGTFATDCGITPGYLSNIEAGRKQPSPEITARIATRLGVALDDITHVEMVGAA